jgi:hypothetical protein
MGNLTAAVCLAVALLIGGAGMCLGADFQKGLEAAQSGDYATALRELTPLAEQGGADAQFTLGLMYRNGWGVPQDYRAALKWFSLAAEQGNARGQYRLGLMYRNGWGVPQDYKAALKWFSLAAEQGDARAQFALGLMYRNGWGVPQNHMAALKWWRLAAEPLKAGSTAVQAAIAPAANTPAAATPVVIPPAALSAKAPEASTDQPASTFSLPTPVPPVTGVTSAPTPPVRAGTIPDTVISSSNIPAAATTNDLSVKTNALGAPIPPPRPKGAL